MHVAQQIRNFFTSEIKKISAFKTTEESRIHPLGKENLPAALIFTENEEVEQATRQGAIQQRIITTTVYVFARAQDTIENQLDALRTEVEKTILCNPTLGGIAHETVLTETNLLLGGEDQDPIGAARMNFVSRVLTKTGDPENPVKNQGVFS